MLAEIAKDRRAAMISAERNGNSNHGNGTQKRVVDVNAAAMSADRHDQAAWWETIAWIDEGLSV